MIETSPHRPCAIVPLPARGGHPPGEAGSAYIIVLLVLVVLTILGLSLALVTQTERQIGTSEKTVQRVFASAESGIYLAVVKAVVLHDLKAMNLELREPRRRLDGTADPTLGNAPLQRHDVSVSVMMPLLDAPCNLCQINRGGSPDKAYSEFNYGLVSTATRRAWTASDSSPAAVLGRQSVSAMVEIQPVPADQTLQASDTGWSNVDDGSSGRQVIKDNPF